MGSFVAWPDSRWSEKSPIPSRDRAGLRDLPPAQGIRRTGRKKIWEKERHYLHAATEAMRRILIDRARGRLTNAAVISTVMTFALPRSSPPPVPVATMKWSRSAKRFFPLPRRIPSARSESCRGMSSPTSSIRTSRVFVRRMCSPSSPISAASLGQEQTHGCATATPVPSTFSKSSGRATAGSSLWRGIHPTHSRHCLRR